MTTLLAPYLFASCALAVVVGCHCAPAPHKPATTGLAVDCPEDNDVRGVPLGRAASYHAKNVAGAVMIYANGQNPTAGWSNLLSVSMLRIYPPQFEFHQKPPEGMAAQVITMYSVCLKNRTDVPFERITIHDSDGAHEIVVEPANGQ